MGLTTPADVCLIVEGTYPYVAGGVASWTHQLLQAQRDLTFHLVCLVAENADLTPRYKLPANVVGLDRVTIGQLPKGAARLPGAPRLFEKLSGLLDNLQQHGGLEDLAKLLSALRPFRRQLGRTILLDSTEAWNLLLQRYRARNAELAFLDYFWTWRIIVSSLYSVLFAPIPPAGVYHSLCTGYAGLFAACAHLETGRPVLLTEHGIYTNERRIELALADWLYRTPSRGLSIERAANGLQELWADTFASYSRACYEAASTIVTLYSGNQQLQLEEGADPAKMAVIPNGVDFDSFSKVASFRTEHPPTVALIGRVVPVKDVKTYIRCIAILREMVPNVRAFVLGPTGEDPQYYAECQALVHHLGIQECLTFMGNVSISEYLPQIDVAVLTSISEAQPLALLEAGAAGVPAIATDVGACREIIYGRRQETEPLGPGGEVVPLSDPAATALAISKLITDRGWWDKASSAIRERVRRYYNKSALDRTYRELYASLLSIKPMNREGAA